MSTLTMVKGQVSKAELKLQKKPWICLRCLHTMCLLMKNPVKKLKALWIRKFWCGHRDSSSKNRNKKRKTSLQNNRAFAYQPISRSLQTSPLELRCGMSPRRNATIIAKYLWEEACWLGITALCIPGFVLAFFAPAVVMQSNFMRGP